jgi:hypothetical protein
MRELFKLFNNAKSYFVLFAFKYYLLGMYTTTNNGHY